MSRRESNLSINSPARTGPIPGSDSRIMRFLAAATAGFFPNQDLMGTLSRERASWRRTALQEPGSLLRRLRVQHRHLPGDGQRHQGSANRVGMEAAAEEDRQPLDDQSALPAAARQGGDLPEEPAGSQGAQEIGSGFALDDNPAVDHIIANRQSPDLDLATPFPEGFDHAGSEFPMVGPDHKIFCAAKYFKLLLATSATRGQENPAEACPPPIENTIYLANFEQESRSDRATRRGASFSPSRSASNFPHRRRRRTAAARGGEAAREGLDPTVTA